MNPKPAEPIKPPTTGPAIVNLTTKPDALRWAFRNHEFSGPKPETVAKLLASDAPEQVKQFVQWLIERNPAAGVKIDCYAHYEGADFNMHIQIRKLY